ncbi:hypothetical protein LTR10_018947 [Elasticomyces elasticus]|uniref:Cryptic loci regulator 2 N-terminal domain-containing protein n=1 Tax=Exophiala sideris TaxID=1016849 RepID=A0ABR0IXX5_9EURO|nr:hypothetical protein LTR10_018947 [Elasticomyces elasticus]KAK5022299.1 hypothetical protein LTS07_010175 [Exophiala sideris]KAK5027111.1 hypothetical protein LTR13_009721 [Exophiala sideris]KAK5051686.1 hypothetical protein LTR69_010186 [Exophiala sideris]KAK5177651.1 hypothetical protein LTR44_009841 [Eurotiomycetes sp. CCFEE 6388]
MPATVRDREWDIIGRKGEHWVKVHVNSFTDGDQSTWPGKPAYRPSSEERYLIHLANSWVKQQGLEEPGTEYHLDKLPDGYATFETDQRNGTQVYKRLFGHPSGRFYDSIVKFEPHFLWLMGGKRGQCECVHCGRPKAGPVIRRTRLPVPGERFPLPLERRKGATGFDMDASGASSRSTPTAMSGRPQRQIKAAGAPYSVDEEGNEDVYKDFLKKLLGARGGTKGIEDDIHEVNSLDWRAEHSWNDYGVDLIQQNLTLISNQHSFVPRVGELVMLTPNFLDGHYLMLDPETLEYKFYSFDEKRFNGFPAWRAGLITAVPAATASDGPIDFPDIQTLPKKQLALNTAGFRVETFPDPNNEVDKTASKQYRYVPLQNIRPLSHWQMLLRGIARDRWHPSIENALTCMTSISVLEKWWFKGDWPQASILCKGLYIGSELIIVGDTVRITPEPSTSKTKRCTDVMIVSDIRVNLVKVRPEDVLPDTPLLSAATSITLVGKAYTLDIRRDYQIQGKDPDADMTDLPSPVPVEEVKTAFRPVGTGEYGTWYRLHDPRKGYEISYDRVLGRLYEAAAVRLWTGQLQTKQHEEAEKLKIQPPLDFDLKAIEEGRRYATQADERLEEMEDDQLGWFWADTRAEALDIQTINGTETGKYDDVRDATTLEQWRTYLKILNGQTVAPEVFKFKSAPQSQVGGRRGRKPGSKVVNGRVIYPGAEGYEEAADEEIPDVWSTPRHKTSQLAGAGLVSTDDEDQDEEGVETFEDAEEVLPSVEARPDHAKHAAPRQPKVQSKAQIMANPDDIEEGEDEEWLFQPPVVRGGTEESEGGDYRPGAE